MTLQEIHEALAPRIICAVCEKPVELVVVERCHYTRSIRIRVFCHGEQDNAELDDLDIVMAGRETLSRRQRAFRIPRIADKPLALSV